MPIRHTLPRVLLLAGLLGAGCRAEPATPASGPAAAEPPPIVVQGAMPVETERLASRLADVRVENVGGWTFWHGRLDGYPVIVSRTQKGVSNVAAATILAIERYRPAAIVNQGTAGGHDPDLHVFDIVLGSHSVNLGAFKTAYRPRGQGSNTLEWTPLDLLASQGSAGEDPNARTMRRFPADARLLAAADSVKGRYEHGRVVTGVIGSADVWNSEIDRIELFRQRYGTAVEEMETASAAQIAAEFNVPFLGVRVLSNNITNDGKYDGKTGVACQDYVFEIVRAYIGVVRPR
jgi:adenosylhomocysteine nucleosidase